MYGGRDERVALRCKNHLAGVIIDRFGKDVMMIPDETDSFKVNVLVTVSEQFFGWLAGLGNGVQLLAPEAVVNEYKQYLQSILTQYQ